MPPRRRNRFQASIAIHAFALATALLVLSPLLLAQVAGNSHSQGLVPADCSTSVKEQITITCNYQAAAKDASAPEDDASVMLDRFEISFGARKAGEMRAELTFTNCGSSPISEARTVYLSVDDDAGRNYLRRILRQVDLRQIGPGESLTFSSRFIAGTFMPGHYIFHLWIPSSDQALKFDPRYNLLLANNGVADRSTGLNVLADFTMGNSTSANSLSVPTKP